ncbi:MAG: AI-2E family transporter [Clostridia bacterium]|nr:AI-2E family transporter [Clostridia bacterium]
MKFAKDPKYNTWALFALIVVIFAALLVSFALHLSAVGAILSRLFAVLSPFIYAGWIMLFVLPALHLFSRLFSALLAKKKKPLKNAKKVADTLALIAAYLILVLIVVLAVVIIIPQFKLLYGIALSSKDYLLKFDAFAASIPAGTFFGKLAAEAIAGLKSSLGEILSALPQYVPAVVDAFKNVIAQASNWLIAVFVSIYALADRRRLVSLCRKCAAAFLPPAQGRAILHFCRLLYGYTVHFFSSRTTVSVTLGVFFYLLFLLLGLRFAAVLCLVVALCNFIPVFGLLLGGALGSGIVLITDTDKALRFILLYLLFALLNAFLLRPRYTHYSVRLGLVASAVCVLTGYFIAGLSGAIFAIPVYITLRRVLPPLYRVAVTRGEKKEAAPENDPPKTDAP